MNKNVEDFYIFIRLTTRSKNFVIVGIMVLGFINIYISLDTFSPFYVAFIQLH